MRRLDDMEEPARVGPWRCAVSCTNMDFRYGDIKKWCLEYDGVGRFYVGVFGQIYIEDDADMEIFLLRWAK